MMGNLVKTDCVLDNAENRMSQAIRWVGAAMVAISLINSESMRAETVALQSGNGAIGGTDSQISMLLGPADAPFSALLTAADFAAAQTGPAASIIANHPAWIATLPSNAGARGSRPAPTVRAKAAPLCTRSISRSPSPPRRPRSTCDSP